MQKGEGREDGKDSEIKTIKVAEYAVPANTDHDDGDNKYGQKVRTTNKVTVTAMLMVQGHIMSIMITAMPLHIWNFKV